MSVARFGETFTHNEVADVDLGDEVYVGLFVCSHNPTVSERAVFKQRADRRAAEGRLGAVSRLHRQQPRGHGRRRPAIGRSSAHVADLGAGAELDARRQGADLQQRGQAVSVRSGDAHDRRCSTPALRPRNNNDHVLSFDGTMLGISHQPAEEQRPLGGLHAAGDRRHAEAHHRELARPISTAGRPTRSCWSTPAGATASSTSTRFPSDGGEEIRLTTTTGLDDGPEYSPDGQWIYFNSMRSGRMQIWRMKPDGSGQEQLTNDEFNNWFPHLSPDGKAMTVLSFLADVKPDDHPFYRQVYIRLMQPDGSSPKVIAYVFGGQGTINVPSWSPDGKRIAFVSNTALPAPH